MLTGLVLGVALLCGIGNLFLFVCVGLLRLRLGVVVFWCLGTPVLFEEDACWLTLSGLSSVELGIRLDLRRLRYLLLVLLTYGLSGCDSSNFWFGYDPVDFRFVGWVAGHLNLGPWERITNYRSRVSASPMGTLSVLLVWVGETAVISSVSG